MARDYYNARAGESGDRPRLDLSETATRIAMAFRYAERHNHLQRSFGFHCVDAGDVPGREGYGVRDSLLTDANVKLSGPIEEAIAQLGHVELFTFIEFVFDHVAKPVEGTGDHHGYLNCGWHFTSTRPKDFDEAAARAEWRAKVNGTLKFYEDGFELSAEGEILRLAADGVAEVVNTPLPDGASMTDAEKVGQAVRTFFRGKASREERKQAVRLLDDVLEYHRLAVGESLGKQAEKDLFHIANKFGIRHHNEFQQDNYSDAFLTWMFHIKLATVHLVLGNVHGVRTFTSTADDDLATGRGKLVL